eukprot:scaffold7066_cov253-Pinguiococcus_pyrenoidosus.AAC.34
MLPLEGGSPAGLSAACFFLAGWTKRPRVLTSLSSSRLEVEIGPGQWRILSTRRSTCCRVSMDSASSATPAQPRAIWTDNPCAAPTPRLGSDALDCFLRRIGRRWNDASWSDARYCCGTRSPNALRASSRVRGKTGWSSWTSLGLAGPASLPRAISSVSRKRVLLVVGGLARSGRCCHDAVQPTQGLGRFAGKGVVVCGPPDELLAPEVTIRDRRHLRRARHRVDLLVAFRLDEPDHLQHGQHVVHVCAGYQGRLGQAQASVLRPLPGLDRRQGGERRRGACVQGVLQLVAVLDASPNAPQDHCDSAHGRAHIGGIARELWIG